MKPFNHAPAFETYSPGRKDARVNEARAMLSVARRLDYLTPDKLSAQFHLKLDTASQLLEYERWQRGE